MTEQMIERLKNVARMESFYDNEDEDVIVDDYAGGNIDDAFELGERAGTIELAREVLKALNIDWVV